MINHYASAILKSGIKLKVSKILLLVLVVTTVVTLACWRLLRPVHAKINVSQSGTAPNYVMTFDNDPANPSSGTTVTFTGNDASGVLTLSEQGGVLTYSSSAKGSQANFKDLSAVQRSVEGLSATQVTRIIVNGGSGDDTLVINNPAGSIFAPNAEIQFNGGDGYDTLILQGGGGPDAHVTYTPGPTKDAGLIETTMGQDRQVINFTGLEPVLDNVSAGSATVNANAGDNAINYAQGPGGGIFVGNTGLVTVDNLESYEFNNKTNVVINGMAGSDTINLNNATVPAGLTGTITVNGGDPTDSDTLIVNSVGRNIILEPTAQNAGTINYFGGGFPSTPFTGIEHLVLVDTATNPFGIDGTTGNDQFIYTPGATPDTGTLVGTMNSGAAQFPLVPITFTGIQQAGVCVFNTFGQQGGTDSFVFNGTAANNNVSLSNGGVFGGITLSDTVNGALFANLNLVNMSGGLTVNGHGPNDVFTHDGIIGIPVTYAGAAAALNFNANGSPVALNLTAQTATDGTGTVTFSGLGTTNVNAAGSTLTVTGTSSDDTLTYTATGPTTATGTLTTAGSSNVINLSNFSGSLTANLLGGNNTLMFNGRINTTDAITYTPATTTSDTGSVAIIGLPTVNFAGIGHLAINGQNGGPGGFGDSLTINTSNLSSGQNEILTPGTQFDSGHVDFRDRPGGVNPTAVPLDFSKLGVAGSLSFTDVGRFDNLIYNGTPLNDTFTVTAGGQVNLNTQIPVSTSSIIALTLAGLDGDDIFNVPGNHNFPGGIVVQGGDPSASDVVNFTASATVANLVTEDFGASSIQEATFAAISVTGVEIANVNANNHNVAVNGTAGGDNITFTPTGNLAGTVTLSGNSLVTKFTSTSNLTLNGLDGNDFFNITPSSSITVNVFGGNPTPPASPGDSLGVNLTGTTGASQTNSSGASGLSGSFTFTNRQAVNFQQIETLSPLTVTGKAFNAVEGVPFSNQIVGTFNAGAIAVNNFTATINWGDNSASTTGVVAANGSGGAFNVQGGHTYNEEGTYNVVVQVSDATTGATQQATSSATVADAPLSVAPQSAGSSTTFSGVGGNNTSVTPGTANAAMLAYQAAIGGVNNGGTASPQNGGFRTINWDGVALTATDGPPANPFTNQVIVPNHVVGIPLNRFQERGMNFSEIYAVADDGFTSVNPSVAGQFPAFSPTKTFAMFNDNSIDFNFVLPSVHNTNVPIQAVTRGFGAIFVDVETPNTTSIEYFNGTTSLGKFFVPVGTTGQAEFFGVLFQNAVVTNVEITLGNATLFSFDGTNVTSGPADNPPGTDLAVTDDFVYPEPQAVSTGININAIAGAPFAAKVASFTDADPNGQVSDYSVIIDWGDGTTSAGGVTPNAAQPESGTMMDTNASITPSVNGGWDVNAAHTYASAGSFTITTSIRDIGGSSISASSTATVTGQPSLSINNVTVTEGNSGTTNAQFTVTLSSASSQTVTVDYATADGTATAPSDYDTQAGTLTFPPGTITRTINIAVKGDTVPEPNETFFVNLFNPVNATISTAQGIGTINDDDESGFVQFSSPTASVAENAGTVSLTVTRTGDTSGVTTVNFETSDGTALQKSDYTFNSGVIQFNPGDTSKTIKISIIDDVFVEGPETFKVTLSNVSGNFVINNPNQVTVTIIDNDTLPPVTNPIDDPTFFVRQQYLDFLGREPDAAGSAFWIGQITACGANPSCISAARVNTSAAFFLSIEYQETSGTVVRLQRAAFGKLSTDPALRVSYLQFMRDTRQIGAGVIVGQPGYDVLLEQNKQAYALQLVNSPAFLARFPIMPAATYVDAVIASTGVTLTAAERTAAINAFGAGGTLGRVAALRSIADSNTVRQAEFIPSFVLAEYFGYLRRNPTDAPDFNDAGYQFWLAKLTAFNGDFLQAEMVKAFITSGEYRQRFGP